MYAPNWPLGQVPAWARVLGAGYFPPGHAQEQHPGFLRPGSPAVPSWLVLADYSHITQMPAVRGG